MDRSGDKYVEDEGGYYVYCGRRDDMLKVGGIYVSPFEVEGALATHPDVLEAAVVAWPDEDQLIKPKAFVVLKAADKAATTSPARCRSTARGAPRPTNIRAGSSFASTCRRPRRQDPALAAGGTDLVALLPLDCPPRFITISQIGSGNCHVTTLRRGGL
jgi:acyl-CoA synthetase (AMP-forming)/AMP-acid ligase II